MFALALCFGCARTHTPAPVLPTRLRASGRGPGRPACTPRAGPGATAAHRRPLEEGHHRQTPLGTARTAHPRPLPPGTARPALVSGTRRPGSPEAAPSARAQCRNRAWRQGPGRGAAGVRSSSLGTGVCVWAHGGPTCCTTDLCKDSGCVFTFILFFAENTSVLTTLKRQEAEKECESVRPRPTRGREGARGSLVHARLGRVPGVRESPPGPSRRFQIPKE